MTARIIIADDYADNRELVRLILTTEGYQVSEAHDGRALVEFARRDPPDLALIDISMPVLDGLSALRELRADEQTAVFPCIALTAFSTEDDRRHALNAGFDEYIAKPFKAKELIEKVARALERRAKGGRREGEAVTLAGEAII